VQILILGAGWTSHFLVPLLEKEQVSYAATSTTGRDGTLKFIFDPEDGFDQYAGLPPANTVLITFPLKGKGQSARLHSQYLATHHDIRCSWIQLGSSGIFTIPGQDVWVTRHSRYDTTDARAIAEDELRELGGTVLNLAGLWGGERNPRHWIDRVAATKEQLKSKNSLHMVHGLDVARAILGVHRYKKRAFGQRYILTDLVVYDWWLVILGFAGELEAEEGSDSRIDKQIRWVGELMQETEVNALPRSKEQLGRCYNTLEFWTSFDVMPIRARI
ncbi:hypothetical protein BJ878DRAFT_426386, partial [Calycina marina]